MTINKNTNFGTHNTTARPGAISYIVVHYLGATGDAKANIEYYNEPTTTSASADFFVGHTGDVWQYNPDPKARYCWAVGGKKYNNRGGSLHGIATNANCVNVEMCVKTKGSKEANSPDWYFTDATIKSAIELVKYLMELYNIPIERVIRHYDVTGKLCPGVIGWNEESGSVKAWESFKASLVKKKEETPVNPPANEMYRVRTTWADAKSQIGAYSVLKNAKKKADENPGYSVFNSAGVKVYPEEVKVETKEEPKVETEVKVDTPFMVRVKIGNLNIRKGPGYKTYASKGYCPIGSYTIMEVKKAEEYTWGRLKSGAGWIALEYTERI